MTSSGCAQLSRGANPEVQIPRDCENIAKRVSVPNPKEGQDMRQIALEHRKMVVKANGRLDATRECQVRLRELYGGTK